MDLTHLLSKGKLDLDILRSIGFTDTEGGLSYHYPIKGTDMYAVYSYSGSALSVSVYDSFDDEPYALFEVEGNPGKFVDGLRYSVLEFAQSFIDKATVERVSMKERFVKLFKEKYGLVPDDPWKQEGEEDSTLVFRLANRKWVGLVMSVPANRFGLAGEQSLDCINLKHKPENIPNIIDNKTIFAAYHMSKKHWITVILGENTDWSLLTNLIEESISLVR